MSLSPQALVASVRLALRAITAVVRVPAQSAHQTTFAWEQARSANTVWTRARAMGTERVGHGEYDRNGLKVETVGRQWTQTRSLGAISLPIEIHN